VAKAQPSSVKLPDLPAALRTCLLKRSCQTEASKAKASGQPVPECTTADGIVIAYVQNEREKLACAATMVKWYREQQTIQASAEKQGHPKTGKPPAKGPTWP
jgi:hypothetical protein